MDNNNNNNDDNSEDHVDNNQDEFTLDVNEEMAQALLAGGAIALEALQGLVTQMENAINTTMQWQPHPPQGIMINDEIPAPLPPSLADMQSIGNTTHFTPTTTAATPAAVGAATNDPTQPAPVDEPNLDRFLAHRLWPNRRETTEVDEDSESDFSGDEKYSSLERQGYEGQQLMDMYDDSRVGNGTLAIRHGNQIMTRLIRQLQGNLAQGRLERLKKVQMTKFGSHHRHHHEIGSGSGGDLARMAALTNSLDGSKMTSASLKSPSTLLQQEQKHSDVSIPDGRPQKLLSRHPQELFYSPSATPHAQCASSLVVTPSPLSTVDKVYTFFDGCIISCGESDIPGPGPFDQYSSDPVTKPSNKYQVKEPKLERLYPLINMEPRDHGHVLTFAHRYGYLVHGVRGALKTYCTHDLNLVNMIADGPMDAGDGTHMVNSVQIVRFPRYEDVANNNSNNNRMDADCDQDGRQDGDDSEMKNPKESNSLDDEENQSLPSHSSPPTIHIDNPFDHYVLATGNHRGIFFGSLPDHNSIPLEKQDMRPHNHEYKYPKEGEWITEPFMGHLINDARASPDGNWIAACADGAMVFLIPITHTLETAEQELQRQRKQRKDRHRDAVIISFEAEDIEVEEDVEVAIDSQDEEETDQDELDSDEPNSVDQVENMESDSEFGNEEEEEEDDDDDEYEISDYSDESDLDLDRVPTCAPADYVSNFGRRLLHNIGTPIPLPIPAHILKSKAHRRFRTHPTRLHASLNSRDYSSQYIAWSADSSRFAHSSDTHSKVLVWSVTTREIVCVVDAAGPSFKIEWNPVVANMLAFASWYGFVHVVDLSGCCVGDEELIPTLDRSLWTKPEVDERTAARFGSGASLGGGGSNRASNFESNSTLSFSAATPIQAGKGCEGSHYEEQHDIVMVSFRGHKGKRLRVLEDINGLGWGSDGKDLYVATRKRVLKYMLMEPSSVKIPTLFDLCAKEVREWQEHMQAISEMRPREPRLPHPFDKQWKYVPDSIRQRIFGEAICLVREPDLDTSINERKEKDSNVMVTEVDENQKFRDVYSWD